MKILHSYSNFLAKKLCEIQQIKEPDSKDVLAYGLEILIASIVSITVTLCISSLFNRCLECLIFLFVFIPLRTYTGGYHSDTHLKCFLVLLFNVMIGGIILLLNVNFFLLSIIMLSLSITIILCFSPIENKNHPLSANQKNKFRKISVVVLIVEVLFTIILMLNKLENLYFGASYGLFSVAASIVITQLKSSERSDENEV